MSEKKVVIIGGGFGGLNVASKLADTEYDVTIIDRTNHHVFQPLLYQVATAALSPADIAIPIRAIFKDNKNIKVVMADAKEIDKANKKVITEDKEFSYDWLIVATGTKHSYFGNDEWEKYAPGLKTISNGLYIREKILKSLEEAEKISDEKLRQKYLTYVIVGGGPTGVELAGAIAEIANRTMMSDFRNFDASQTQVYLVEAVDNILLSFPEDLAKTAKEYLEKMGVKVLLNKPVTYIDENCVKMKDDVIETKNVIWAAGNKASPLLKTLNTETDKAGRVVVEKDCSVKGHPEIFVIGDAALFKDDEEKPLPAVAQVAIQQGKYVAGIIKENTDKNRRGKFKYIDKGSMATVGRAKAVVLIKGFKLTGVLAWIIWSLIHVFFLIGFRNRVRVMAEWAWYYVSFRHGIRLIVGRTE